MTSKDVQARITENQDKLKNVAATVTIVTERIESPAIIAIKQKDDPNYKGPAAPSEETYEWKQAGDKWEWRHPFTSVREIPAQQSITGKAEQKTAKRVNIEYYDGKDFYAYDIVPAHPDYKPYYAKGDQHVYKVSPLSFAFLLLDEPITAHIDTSKTEAVPHGEDGYAVPLRLTGNLSGNYAIVDPKLGMAVTQIVQTGAYDGHPYTIQYVGKDYKEVGGLWLPGSATYVQTMRDEDHKIIYSTTRAYRFQNYVVNDPNFKIGLELKAGASLIDMDTDQILKVQANQTLKPYTWGANRPSILAFFGGSLFILGSGGVCLIFGTAVSKGFSRWV